MERTEAREGRRDGGLSFKRGKAHLPLFWVLTVSIVLNRLLSTRSYDFLANIQVTDSLTPFLFPLCRMKDRTIDRWFPLRYEGEVEHDLRSGLT